MENLCSRFNNNIELVGRIIGLDEHLESSIVHLRCGADVFTIYFFTNAKYYCKKFSKGDFVFVKCVLLTFYKNKYSNFCTRLNGLFIKAIPDKVYGYTKVNIDGRIKLIGRLFDVKSGIFRWLEIETAGGIGNERFWLQIEGDFARDNILSSNELSDLLGINNNHTYTNKGNLINIKGRLNLYHNNINVKADKFTIIDTFKSIIDNINPICEHQEVNTYKNVH